VSDVRPVAEGLFTTDPPRLLGSRCPACDAPHFPRREQCPYCSSGGCTPVEFAGPGRLWAFTSVTAPPPGYLGEVPYGFGVVELVEGLRVIGRLTVADPSTLAFDQPVHLVIDDLATDDDGRRIVTYAFAPGEAP
jgi:uncharacterized OB-fold protein